MVANLPAAGNRPDLLAYSGKKQQKLKGPISLKHNQSSIPELVNSDSLPSPFSNPMCDIDLHIPIVIRKGMRTCTKCPLSNLLSFHRLSLNYKGFKTNFPSDFVPQNISNA